MPKSSSANRMPLSRSCCMTPLTCSKELMSTLSVISNSSCCVDAVILDDLHDPADEIGLKKLDGGNVHGDLERKPATLAMLNSWRQTVSSTRYPTSTMRPVSSATGMNSAGEIKLPAASRRRNRASALRNKPVLISKTGWKCTSKSPLARADRMRIWSSFLRERI